MNIKKKNKKIQKESKNIKKGDLKFLKSKISDKTNGRKCRSRKRSLVRKSKIFSVGEIKDFLYTNHTKNTFSCPKLLQLLKELINEFVQTKK